MIELALSELYEDKIYTAICKRYGKDNGEDLKGEIIIILLEMPLNKLEHLIKEKILLPYALQIARFQSGCNPRTKFNKKYNQKCLPLPENINDVPDETIDYSLGDFISSHVLKESLEQSNKHFYHANLVIERAKYKNTKELSRATKIPYYSLRHALNEYKQFLNEQAENENLLH